MFSALLFLFLCWLLPLCFPCLVKLTSIYCYSLFPELFVSSFTNGDDLFNSGIYPPQVKVYELRELSMKFERHLISEIVNFQVLNSHRCKLIVSSLVLLWELLICLSSCLHSLLTVTLVVGYCLIGFIIWTFYDKILYVHAIINNINYVGSVMWLCHI